MVGSFFVKMSSSVQRKRDSSSQYESYLTCEMAVNLPSLYLRESVQVRERFLEDDGLNASRRHLRQTARAASDGFLGRAI